MSAKLLLEIALRVMGLWFFFNSIVTLVSIVAALFSLPGQYSYLWGIVAIGIAQFFLGGMLAFGAPAVATWFYPQAAESEGDRVSVGPGDIYRTACFVLGAWLLVATVHPAERLVTAGLNGNQAARFAGDAATLIVYAASGLLLVFGSRSIAELLANLRYDPDTIPKQQVSLAMLLTLIVVVAIALAAFRMISLAS